MRHFRRCWAWLLAGFLGVALAAPLRAQTAVSPVVGNWKTGDGQYTLVLHPDGKGTLNATAIQWTYRDGMLRLDAAKSYLNYKAAVTATTLTLSGNDLKQGLVFQRSDAAAPPLTTSDKLPIPGNPPLTQDMVERVVRLFEWLLDAKLTQEQRQQFQASIVTSWKTQNQKEIADTLAVLKLHDDLGKRSEADRSALHEALLAQYLQDTRKTPDDPLSQWVLGIYYAAHTPIATGNPPLTRQVADAYAELNCFMIGVVRGPEAFQPTKDFKDLFSKSLAAQWPRLSAAQQQEMSQLPVAWAAIQLGWSSVSAADRAKYREQWTPAVQAMYAPAASGNATASAAARPSGASSSDVYRKFQEQQMVHRMLFNMNQDFLHKYYIAPGTTYLKYGW